MIPIGTYQKLKVLRDTPSGLFLGNGEDIEAILLPGKYIPKGTKVGDTLEVFIYNDSEDRPVCTTLKPYITLHSFACLDVVAITNAGAFLDWGLDKDILVPYREQKVPMKLNEKYVVFLYVDEKTQRLAASSKLSKFYLPPGPELVTAEEQDILVVATQKQGYEAVVNQAYKGVIPFTGMRAGIFPGDQFKGYIKKVMSNGELEISVGKNIQEAIPATTNFILEKLKQSGGFLPLGDHSTPEEILKQVHMSKKAFKKNIGILYSDRLIRIEDKGIYLV